MVYKPVLIKIKLWSCDHLNQFQTSWLQIQLRAEHNLLQQIQQTEKIETHKFETHKRMKVIALDLWNMSIAAVQIFWMFGTSKNDVLFTPEQHDCLSTWA